MWYGSEVKENEQWKRGGDCSKCRRQSYCHDSCAEKNRAIYNVIQEAFVEFVKKEIEK